MLGSVKGFLSFISFERGLMLFMIAMGATFLVGQNPTFGEAAYLGFVAFCLWSGVDAINNVYDVDLDMKSDSFRADFTRSLGKFGIIISLAIFAVCMALGLITGIQLVTVFIFVGIVAGVVYSVPPFRLRQTILKPLVNVSVGAVPVLIVASFFDIFSFELLVLVLLIGISTGANSLWEDLADYESDFAGKARTLVVVLGFKRGFFITVLVGYSMVPLMVLVGILFNLNLLYFVVLGGLIAFLSLRLIQHRNALFRSKNVELNSLLTLGTSFARDFVIIALVQTANLMINGFLNYQQTVLV
jgi:4-hydroxybenzoate polyprenyltransferase